MGPFPEDAETEAKYALMKVDVFDRFEEIVFLTNRETEMVCQVLDWKFDQIGDPVAVFYDTDPESAMAKEDLESRGVDTRSGSTGSKRLTGNVTASWRLSFLLGKGNNIVLELYSGFRSSGVHVL